MIAVIGPLQTDEISVGNDTGNANPYSLLSWKDETEFPAAQITFLPGTQCLKKGRGISCRHLYRPRRRTRAQR